MPGGDADVSIFLAVWAAAANYRCSGKVDGVMIASDRDSRRLLALAWALQAPSGRVMSFHRGSFGPPPDRCGYRPARVPTDRFQMLAVVRERAPGTVAWRGEPLSRLLARRNWPDRGCDVTGAPAAAGPEPIPKGDAGTHPTFRTSPRPTAKEGQGAGDRPPIFTTCSSDFRCSRSIASHHS